ncbi:preprotein translocase subunit SecE [Fodinisporobacter ferrooxydans]|uniref:Protein translocase subunit SecE n=1 Tax=Fodinisporobacter ferrooxydans TaxID=2901836 RepID=A0ABY4CRP6_9BACL|nr:preprotein translocase subunit SecE [Alicyclobacillaceae bacterium MYW30-H2]
MSSFVGGLRSGSSKLISYFKEGVSELKRVRWPNRKQTINYTAVVIITVLFLSVVVYLFDLGISKLLNLIGF